MTSSRRSCSKSTSMSGGSARSAEMKRSNRTSWVAGSTEVTPRQKQTAELAAEPRPWHRMPRSRANLTRSEEHTSELQSLMRISYAVFCLKKKNNRNSNRQRLPLHERKQITERH